MVYRCNTDDDKLPAVHFLLYANAFGGSCLNTLIFDMTLTIVSAFIALASVRTVSVHKCAILIIRERCDQVVITLYLFVGVHFILLS